MNYAGLEAKAKKLSAKGWKIRMWQTPNEWHWEWAFKGHTVVAGHTTAAVQPVALAFALQSLT